MMGGFELVLREQGRLLERGDDCSESGEKEGEEVQGFILEPPPHPQPQSPLIPESGTNHTRSSAFILVSWANPTEASHECDHVCEP